MIRFVTQNWGWKLLSLALSFMLWIALAREPELAASVSAPIEFKNLPEDLDISSNVPERIHVEVRGPSGRLSRDYMADIATVLDLADARPGERTYTVHGYNINLPVGVAFYRAVPSQITLRFERLLERDVTVVPRYVNTVEGYAVVRATVDPPVVRIRGPEQRVKQLEQVFTDPIDLSGVVGRADYRVYLNLGDPVVRVESAAPLAVHVTLAKTGEQAPSANR